MSVGLSVTVVSSANSAEPIEMPFGLRTLVDPRNHVLDGSRYPMARGNFYGEGAAHCKLEMWANAKRDGRPAEYRWRPPFNASKFG